MNDTWMSRRSFLYGIIATNLSPLYYANIAKSEELELGDLRLMAMRNSLIRANIKSVLDRTIGQHGLTDRGISLYREEMRKQFNILSNLRDTNVSTEFLDKIIYNDTDLSRSFVNGVLDIVGYQNIEDLINDDKLNDKYINLGTIAANGGLGYAAYAGTITGPWAIGGVALVGLLGLTAKSTNDPTIKIQEGGQILKSLHYATLNAMKGNLRNNILVLYGYLRANHPKIADKFAPGLRDGLNGNSVTKLRGFLNGVEIALDDLAEMRKNGQIASDQDLRKAASKKLPHEMDKAIALQSSESDEFFRQELESAAILAAGILEYIFKQPGLQRAVVNLLNASKHLQKLHEISKAFEIAKKTGAVAQNGQTIGLLTMAASTFQVYVAGIALLQIFAQMLSGSGEKPEITFLRAIYDFLLNFREEMHSRFDVVEARLGNIERKIDELMGYLQLSINEIIINRAKFERSLALQTNIFIRTDYQRFRDVSELNRTQQRAILARNRNLLKLAKPVVATEIENAIYSLYEIAIAEAEAGTSKGPIRLERDANFEEAIAYYENDSIPISQKSSIIESTELHYGSLKLRDKIANPLVLGERLAEICSYILEFRHNVDAVTTDQLLSNIQKYIDDQAAIISKALSKKNLNASLDNWSKNEKQLIAAQFGKPNRRFDNSSGSKTVGSKIFQPADNLVGLYQEWHHRTHVVGKTGARRDTLAIEEIFKAISGVSEYSKRYPNARISQNKLSFVEYEYGNSSRQYNWRWRRLPEYITANIFRNIDIVKAANGLVEQTKSGFRYHPNVPLFPSRVVNSERKQYQAIILRSSLAYDKAVRESGYPPRNPDVRVDSIYSIASIYGSHGVYTLGGDSKAYYSLRRKVANIHAQKIIYAPVDPIREAIAYGVLQVEWVRGFDCNKADCPTGFSKKRFRLRNKNDNSVIILDFGELVYPGERQKRVLLRSIHTAETSDSRGERLGIPEGKEVEAFENLYNQVKVERLRLLSDSKYERSLPWFIQKVVQGVISPKLLTSYSTGAKSLIDETVNQTFSSIVDSRLYSEVISSSLAMRHLFQSDSLSGAESFLREYRQYLNPKKLETLHLDFIRKVSLLEKGEASLVHDFLFKKIDQLVKELEDNHIPDEAFASETYKNLSSYVSGLRHLAF